MRRMLPALALGALLSATTLVVLPDRAFAAKIAVPKPSPKLFYVLGPSHQAGFVLKTGGGPNVPDKANPGRTHGTIAPQAGGCNYRFKGRIGGRMTSACILPLISLPAAWDALGEATWFEEEVFEEGGPSTAIRDLERALDALADFEEVVDALETNGKLTHGQHDALIAQAEAAAAHDRRAIRKFRRFKVTGDDRFARQGFAQVNDGLSHKYDAFGVLPSSLIRALPPTDPGSEVPTDLDPGTTAVASAEDDRSGYIALVLNPGASSQAALFDGGVSLLGNTTPSRVLTFGPGWDVAGQQDNRPVSFDRQNGYATQLLPTNSTAHIGSVLGGDNRFEVGFRITNAGVEKARAWEFAGKSINGFDVGHFAGGSSLFTANGSGLTAFGDHFLHGSSGRYRAFRANLRTRDTTNLFAPKGGSSQPTSSNAELLAGGGSVFSNGSIAATFWWADRHYVRFRGVGQDTLVNGENDAGVGVGILGPPASSHAALFEGGHAYDLNDLIANGSGWTLTKANDITNKGRIVGTGLLNGNQRAFELDLSP